MDDIILKGVLYFILSAQKCGDIGQSTRLTPISIWQIGPISVDFGQIRTFQFSVHVKSLFVRQHTIHLDHPPTRRRLSRLKYRRISIFIYSTHFLDFLYLFILSTSRPIGGLILSDYLADDLCVGGGGVDTTRRLHKYKHLTPDCRPGGRSGRQQCGTVDEGDVIFFLVRLVVARHHPLVSATTERILMKSPVCRAAPLAEIILSRQHTHTHIYMNIDIFSLRYNRLCNSSVYQKRDGYNEVEWIMSSLRFVDCKFDYLTFPPTPPGPSALFTYCNARSIVNAFTFRHHFMWQNIRISPDPFGATV